MVNEANLNRPNTEMKLHGIISTKSAWNLNFKSTEKAF